MAKSPVISVTPFVDDAMRSAVEKAGATLGEPDEADAIVWTNPGDPEGLRALLGDGRPGWVQLPFAGIERFVEAGVIDEGRTWTCAKGIYGPACAEHALALMLGAARCLHVHVRSREWREAGLGSPERRLDGATVVIIGTGGIGQALVAMLDPFDVRIIGVNRSGRPLEGAERTVPVSELGDVIADGDFVVLAAAMTPETRGLIDHRMLKTMRADGWVVNVARGPMVDTDGLVDALRAGEIGGAALDVTDPEPLPAGHPLWELDNAIITPHIANTWDMALPELTALIERNVAHYVRGEPLEGLVDPALGY